MFDTEEVSTAAPVSLRDLAERARPVALAREQVLPVLPALHALMPGGALRRGSTVVITGEAATSLALALAAAPSVAGSWVAAVGLPRLGLDAATELGLSLERLVLVPDVPPASWGAVVAALVGAADLVLMGPEPGGADRRVRATDARRLAARARERGSVLVVVDPRARSTRSSLQADLRLSAGEVRWHGLGRGHGHLEARHVVIDADGRREAARPRRVSLWLPHACGEVLADADVPAPVTPLVRRTALGGRDDGRPAGTAEPEKPSRR